MLCPDVIESFYSAPITSQYNAPPLSGCFLKKPFAREEFLRICFHARKTSQKAVSFPLNMQFAEVSRGSFNPIATWYFQALTREIKFSGTVWLQWLHLFEHWASIKQDLENITINSLYLKIQKENYSLLVSACKLVHASMRHIIRVESWLWSLFTTLIMLWLAADLTQQNPFVERVGRLRRDSCNLQLLIWRRREGLCYYLYWSHFALLKCQKMSVK